MADTTEPAVAHDHGDHADGEHIHMPPNSWVPISVALALTCTFVGFLTTKLGPTVWIIGLVWLAASCVVWYRAAVTEYNELPD